MATLRLRALRGLALARGLLLPSAAGGALVAAMGFRAEAWLLVGVPVGVALIALVVRVPGDSQAAARRLDHHHDLRGLLLSGLAFAQRPREALTPFEQACLTQAAERSEGLNVTEAIPLRRPLQGVLVGTLVACILVFAVPPALRPVGPTITTTIPGAPAQRDAGLDSTLTEALAKLESQLQSTSDGGVSSLQKELQALAAAAAANPARVAEVLNRLDVLAARAQEAGQTPELASFTRELSAIAQFAQLGEALQAGSPEQVRAAMAALSQQLQQASPAQRTKLRRELKTLREHLARERRDPSLLHRPRSPVRTDVEEAQAALERTLESLEARGKDPSEALASLGRSLERLARHARDAQAEREAGRAMQQLAERTRRGDGSPDSPGDGKREGQGQQGPRQEQLGGFLRPRSEGTGENSGEAANQGSEGPRLAAPEGAQHSPGHGPGAPLLGEPAGAVESQGSPSRVRADSDDGPSRSQVIAEVSARGVRSPGYRKVHAEYEAHAVQQMEQSPLSRSDRYVVRRYFDLIAPKERP